jgi:hypothetical protein
MNRERLIQIVTEEVQKELSGTGTREVAPGVRARKMLVTEEMMLKAAKEGCKELKVPKDAIITPFARDRALEFRIKIVKG